MTKLRHSNDTLINFADTFLFFGQEDEFKGKLYGVYNWCGAARGPKHNVVSSFSSILTVASRVRQSTVAYKLLER